jgi:hypothetical protein
MAVDKRQFGRQLGAGRRNPTSLQLSVQGDRYSINSSAKKRQ